MTSDSSDPKKNSPRNFSEKKRKRKKNIGHMNTEQNVSTIMSWSDTTLVAVLSVLVVRAANKVQYQQQYSVLP